MQAECETIVSLPGPLMLAIMSALWRDKLTFRGLHRVLCRDYKPIALSTLSTTLRRLVERGWVQRVSHGSYVSALSRDNLKLMVTEVIDQA